MVKNFSLYIAFFFSRATNVLQAVNAKRINAFLATSQLCMAVKLRMSPEEELKQAKRSIRFARNFAADVQSG